MSSNEKPDLSTEYHAVMVVTTPTVGMWSRLEVTGLEHIPASGPTLILANHESYWDPVAIGLAAKSRRQICALAKSSLWKNAVVGKILDGMGQIPIKRGTGDAGALDDAIAKLREGTCIGVFPEGTRSEGRKLRARSGAGFLAKAVPETTIVLARVRGTTDIVRFPKRPHVRVEFFPPAGGQLQEGESAARLMTRLMAEIRADVPPETPGRSKTAAKLRARNAAEPAKK